MHYGSDQIFSLAGHLANQLELDPTSIDCRIRSFVQGFENPRKQHCQLTEKYTEKKKQTMDWTKQKVLRF